MNSVEKTGVCRRVPEIIARLREGYPGARCALIYSTEWQLLVATVLSAQCTDKRVNVVTKALFRKYQDIAAFAKADIAELEEDIRSTGFFRNKAKNIVAASRQILERHNGEVPATMEELILLPGVGRKTANVVLGNGYGIPGLVVDTHVKRIAIRLGWTRHNDPVKIEKDLSEMIPKEEWVMVGHMLIAHGRAVCRAPVPVCSECLIREFCPRVGVNRSR